MVNRRSIFVADNYKSYTSWKNVVISYGIYCCLYVCFLGKEVKNEREFDCSGIFLYRLCSWDF